MFIRLDGENSSTRQALLIGMNSVKRPHATLKTFFKYFYKILFTIQIFACRNIFGAAFAKFVRLGSGRQNGGGSDAAREILLTGRENAVTLFTPLVPSSLGTPRPVALPSGHFFGCGKVNT